MDVINWPRGQTHAFRCAAIPFPLARPNAQERAGMWGNCSGLSFVVVGLSMKSNCRAMQPTGHSEINLGLHLHAEIGLSHSLHAPFKYRMY